MCRRPACVRGSASGLRVGVWAGAAPHRRFSLFLSLSATPEPRRLLRCAPQEGKCYELSDYSASLLPIIFIYAIEGQLI